MLLVPQLYLVSKTNEGNSQDGIWNIPVALTTKKGGNIVYSTMCHILLMIVDLKDNTIEPLIVSWIHTRPLYSGQLSTIKEILHFILQL